MEERDMSDNSFQLEKAFRELEGIIEQLESEEVPLKDSIELYGKGAKLIAQCKEELSGIEKEMIIIGEELDGKKVEE